MERNAAALATKLGTHGRIAYEYAYRLYAMSERKKRPKEAIRYNAVVQTWPEISRLAREISSHRTEQTTLFEGEPS